MITPVECAIFEPGHGDNIRILLEYENGWRPILWMEVSKDGSIYLGPRKKTVSEIRQNIVHCSSNQPIQIKYSDGVEITNTKDRNRLKISFHSSGIVNSPTGRSIRSAIRSLESQELLCILLFQHPKEFDVVPAVRKRDVCLRYPIDEQRPFYARLYIAPSRDLIPVLDDSAKYQLGLIFEYPARPEIKALTLQLVISHGPEGPWPPYTVTLYEIVDDFKSQQAEG